MLQSFLIDRRITAAAVVRQIDALPCFKVDRGGHSFDDFGNAVHQ